MSKNTIWVSVMGKKNGEKKWENCFTNTKTILILFVIKILFGFDVAKVATIRKLI
jgi:hypothetical protein